MCYFYKCDYCFDKILVGCPNNPCLGEEFVLGDPSLGRHDCERCGDIPALQKRSVGWHARRAESVAVATAAVNLAATAQRNQDLLAQMRFFPATVAAAHNSASPLVGMNAFGVPLPASLVAKAVFEQSWAAVGTSSSAAGPSTAGSGYARKTYRKGTFVQELNAQQIWGRLPVWLWGSVPGRPR